MWQNGLVGKWSLWGVCMSYRKACLVVLLISSTAALAKFHIQNKYKITPPLVRAIDPPAPDATAADLEQQADRLRAEKLYLDALDYYRAALNKKGERCALAE